MKFYPTIKIAILGCLLALGSFGKLAAQSEVALPAKPGDSLLVFPLEAFYERVLEYHPLVQQAGLLSEEAERQIMEARGAFDPKLESNFDRKVFKDTHYFTTWKSELKLPLLINTDLKVGYEQNRGYYLNDQQAVPEAGLLYAGISVPLGQGLFTDPRRTGLRSANFNIEIAEAERVKVLNKLLYEAAKDYWNWSLAYFQLQTNEEGVDLARIRFEGIVERVEAGDAAPIDSVEASITLQSREIELVQSRLDYRNALLQLTLYLWGEEGVPLIPAAGLMPDTLWEVRAAEPLQPMEVLADLALNQHPEVRKLQNKMQQLEVEEGLYRELLKPLVNINYNYLNMPGNMFSELSGSTFTENYKLGVDFSFPLLLRKERAKLQINRIKQQRTLISLNVSRREIGNVLQQAYNDYLTLRQVLSSQQQVVANYRLMLEGELEMFEAGESSLFLVNQRENKLLEAQLKLLSLAAKYQKARAAVLWSAGLSVPDFDILPVQGLNR